MLAGIDNQCMGIVERTGQWCILAVFKRTFQFSGGLLDRTIHQQQHAVIGDDDRITAKAPCLHGCFETVEIHHRCAVLALGLDELGRALASKPRQQARQVGSRGAAAEGIQQRVRRSSHKRWRHGGRLCG
ncbi:MAG: hypothetical protein DI536_37170 [Archangium gephyra]|uniref:Uncharacterized protein n=1 Tax=Archangium gephyra TaxID=48 RepID=A0A2W5SRG0_9BACT|nr:MAG: hypothetical protein DI536_37170 [Archangium gephyra]